MEADEAKKELMLQAVSWIMNENASDDASSYHLKSSEANSI